jgi:hypothetical protein
MRRFKPIVLFTIITLLCPCAFSQTATLRGVVTDESAAVVPGAKVTLTGPSGLLKTAASANDGSYSFTNLPFGAYTLEAAAPELALSRPAKIEVRSALQTVNLQLKVASTSQQVTVRDNAGPAVSTDAANNAGALVLRGNDLQALSDDPEDLAADLQALAGPSAGPNGGSIFIDGFSGGQLPSKDSIREIRINQNPFSPEYDKIGFGRIEILTKPGTDKLKGTAFYNFGDSFWNSRDPYAQQKAPFLLKEYGGNISGPINSRASFFLDVQRHAIDNGAIIDAITLDPQTLRIIDPFTQVFRSPQRRIVVSPRVDYQINSNNTLSIRYQTTLADIQDSGIGALNLVSRGEHAHSLSQTVQATETAVLGTNVINETRFQFFRVDSSISSNDPGAAIQVLGAFNGGGAQTGNSADTQNNYELQNYTTIAAGKHAWKFGVRLREQLETNISPQDFGGMYTFAGGLAPELDANNQPATGPGGQPVMVQITSIESYQRTLLFEQMGLGPTQIQALGGGPAQFTLNAGIPGISANQFDAGLFAGDNWRMRPNLTLSLGLRYEMQTNIRDWRDIAPRVGLAWAPGGSGRNSPKTVIRAGFGTFYDRFALTNVLTALRYNGVVQQQYVVTDPTFYPAIPSPAALAASPSTQTIWETSSTLRAPYLMQSALGVERQLPGKTTIAVTYSNSHGLHQLRSADINAPLPGTYNPLVPESGVFPFPGRGPVFLMESSGLYNQNQVIVNVNSNVNSHVSLFGYYVYNRALSNTDGLSTFAANPYSDSGEYGPASTDIRNRVSFGGTLTAKCGIRFNPLFTANTGPPFDITTGSDLYGDTLFTARPGIATDPNRPGLIATKYGLLDPDPTAGEQILPRNFGRGPGSIMFNLRIGKVFTFGPKGEGSIAAGGGNRGSGGVFTSGQTSSNVSTGHRYNLSISLAIRNLLNHNNPGPITGNITSPFFGLANQSAGATSLGGTNFLESANNRRLELQTRFTF